MIAAIISPDASLRSRIEEALGARADVSSVLVISEYPNASDIRSLDDKRETCVAFIDFGEDSNRALAAAGEIGRSCPSAGVVAINVGSSQADMIAIVRAGICDVLPHPFSDRDVTAAVLNVTRKLAGASGAVTRSGVVHAFVPAKPGSGASSLAVYSALGCANRPDCHPLLLDFDVRLGNTSFVLKLDSMNSIIDAFQNAARMDDTLWGQLISEREKLDVLGSAPTDAATRVPFESFQTILSWARSRYTALIVDLPGAMEDFEIATMQQSGTIFLVCGTDMASVHMATRKIQQFRELQLLDRICVVINRVDKRHDLALKDIEGVLGLPIGFTVPTDEATIADAVRKGTGVNQKSAFGLQIEAIVHKMAGSGPNPIVPRRKRQFLEFFSIPSKEIDPWHL